MPRRNAKFTLSTRLKQWFGMPAAAETIDTTEAEITPAIEDSGGTHIIRSTTNASSIPYDPELLDRARMQWQFGDWKSLTKIDMNILEHHPERAKLALVVASAWQQLNDQAAARRYIKLAKEWGCDKKIMAQLLIAGVYNTLGRCASIGGDESRAQAHFRLAVKGGGGDERLASHARATHEMGQLQLKKRIQNQITDELSTSQSNTHLQAAANVNEISGSSDNPFLPGIVSYAQNFEDVMLWRALRHLEKGFYIDIGAQDPVVDSVSKAFYERGWRGIHVEASPAYAEALRNNRPDEVVIEAAVAEHNGEMTFYEIPETGLSTGDAEIAHGHVEKKFEVREIKVACTTLAEIFALAGDQEIHWLKIDVEGMETQVLASWRKSKVRPWIVVIESTLPNTQIETHKQWEHLLLERGYRHSYSDGLNRFYVSEYHAELGKALQYGPNVFDNFTLSGTASASFCSLTNTKLKQKRGSSYDEP
ncbi:FkbM family methyltransferase [Nitrosomonas communis]|uniref:Methyltransferase, FkbM family n=1 Tax=Nitrosomonas communis TaxID=44574 RepID=A0A1H2Q970_9PROT|nr:FkbM family methyltransferase [Nitrosomonas communis]SDW03733.1 methyltransferase, FkbM family [Nitrosomonas communis]